MKILVAGGRHFGEKQVDWGDHKVWEPNQEEIDYLNQTLDAIHAKKKITCIVQGEASGADLLAKAWAIRNNVEHLDYPAEWSKYGAKAGPIRNATMYDDNPDIQCAVFFKGGKGTENCMKQAKFRKVNILDCRG